MCCVLCEGMVCGVRRYGVGCEGRCKRARHLRHVSGVKEAAAVGLVCEGVLREVRGTCGRAEV